MVQNKTKRNEHPGLFDIQPKARRLRDGREVPFDGVASLDPSHGEKRPLSSSSSPRKGGELAVASVTAFDGGSTVRDPDDFDVFRKGPGELWDGDELGVAGAKVKKAGVSSPLNVVNPHPTSDQPEIKKHVPFHDTAEGMHLFCGTCL